MSIDLLIEIGWKSALCAGLTLLALALLRRRSAGERALVADVGVLALLLLPAAVLALPALRFEAPESMADMLALVTATPAPAETSQLGMPTAITPAFDWGGLLATFYLAVCAAFLFGLLISLLRLQRVRARAALIQDPHWLTALAAAQHRAGFKQGTALLSSGELKSPVSWGLIRPTIIVDDAALVQKDRAEAIMTHELAHVTRMDWLRLMLGRVALAIFWFNPLVWVLVRTSHHLSEEAADDAVLRTEIPECDYADLLVGAVRHAHRPAFLPVNGVAPSRSSLSKRISHVLDSSRTRRPARLGWAVGSLCVAASLNGIIAAAEPLAARAPEPAPGATAEAAAEQLDRLGDPHRRALAQALRTRDRSLRAPEGKTTFNQPAAVPAAAHAAAPALIAPAPLPGRMAAAQAAAAPAVEVPPAPRAPISPASRLRAGGPGEKPAVHGPSFRDRQLSASCWAGPGAPPQCNDADAQIHPDSLRAYASRLEELAGRSGGNLSAGIREHAARVRAGQISVACQGEVCASSATPAHQGRVIGAGSPQPPEPDPTALRPRWGPSG